MTELMAIMAALEKLNQMVVLMESTLAATKALVDSEPMKAIVRMATDPLYNGAIRREEVRHGKDFNGDGKVGS